MTENGSSSCFFGVTFQRFVKSGRLDAYLVGAPVPHGRDGHAEDDAGPRQVRVDRVPEQVEGVVSGDAAGGVWHGDGRDGVGVAFHQSVPAADLHKAWR